MSILGTPFNIGDGSKYYINIGTVNLPSTNNWLKTDVPTGTFTDHNTENRDYYVIDYTNTQYPPVNGDGIFYEDNITSPQGRLLRLDIILREGKIIDDEVQYYDYVSADEVSVFAKFQIEKY